MIKIIAVGKLKEKFSDAEALKAREKEGQRLTTSSPRGPESRKY